MSKILINHQINSSPFFRCLLYRPLGTSAGSGTVNNIDSNSNISNQNSNNKANPDQLVNLEEKLLHLLPKFFAIPHPLNLYSKDVVLIDNIRNLRVQGLAQYGLQVGLFRVYHFIKYSSIKVELLNLVKNPEESYIKVRWRIITKPGLLQFALFFWKLKSLERWKDGISTFHVNSEGKIHCHVCDNIDVDIDDIGNKQKSIKNPLINRGLNV